MSKKDVFVAEITEIIENVRKTTGAPALSEDAMAYFEAFASENEKGKKKFSDNGIIILNYMRDNKDAYKNLFKAKDFEAAGLTSRGASGAMRKLVNDGYVEKLGKDPVLYGLTELGETVELTIEEE